MEKNGKRRPKPYHLVVFPNKSVLVKLDGSYETFVEGPMSKKAKANQKKIMAALNNGFLEKLIEEETPGLKSDLWKKLRPEIRLVIDNLMNSVTSEVGRALVGLTVLQLCIKSISSDQSVRLHKSSSNKAGFSWADGLPMRVLDKRYITTVLRKYDLLKLNADGFMMTRSLAENYPYCGVYKAAIRGAKKEWIQIVEWLESGNIDALTTLQYLIAVMIDKKSKLTELEGRALEKMNAYCAKNPVLEETLLLIKEHIKNSQYGARLLEIAMHSLFQVLEDEDVIDGKISPLSQMRSANKKHDNVGDVEISSPESQYIIFEAWDSKYGKSYLFDELCELEDKLDKHGETKIVGFVTDAEPSMQKEIKEKISEIEDEYGVKVFIYQFDEFVKNKIGKSKIKDIGSKWIIAYTESLAQKRRGRAPIDEPCHQWLSNLIKIFEKHHVNVQEKH